MWLGTCFAKCSTDLLRATCLLCGVWYCDRLCCYLPTMRYRRAVLRLAYGCAIWVCGTELSLWGYQEFGELVSIVLKPFKEVSPYRILLRGIPY
eukprot:3940391-Rhodomonas_salina.4